MTRNLTAEKRHPASSRPLDPPRTLHSPLSRPSQKHLGDLLAPQGTLLTASWTPSIPSWLPLESSVGASNTVFETASKREKKSPPKPSTPARHFPRPKKALRIIFYNRFYISAYLRLSMISEGPSPLRTAVIKPLGKRKEGSRTLPTNLGNGKPEKERRRII